MSCRCQECIEHCSVSTLTDQNVIHHTDTNHRFDNFPVTRQPLPSAPDRNGSKINNLSLSPYLSRTCDASTQRPSSFNISTERQTSLDENDHACANLQATPEFYPPSDYEEEDFQSIEHLRLQNPDETEVKVSRPRPVKPNESFSTTRETNHLTNYPSWTKGQTCIPAVPRREIAQDRTQIPYSSTTGESESRRYSGSDLPSPSSSIQDIPRSKSAEKIQMQCTCGPLQNPLSGSHV